MFLLQVCLQLHIEQLSAKRSRVIELEEKENALGRPVTTADVGLFPEDHQPLVYRAEALPLGSVPTTPVKKREPSSSMMTVGCQSKKVTRTSFDQQKRKRCSEKCDKARKTSLTRLRRLCAHYGLDPNRLFRCERWPWRSTALSRVLLSMSWNTCIRWREVLPCTRT